MYIIYRKGKKIQMEANNTAVTCPLYFDGQFVTGGLTTTRL